VRAFAKHGYAIDADRIGPEVGKGGDNLVPAILGESANDRDGDALRESAGAAYVHIVTHERRVHAFDRGVELLGAVRARGLRTALATSSGDQDLDATFDSAGVDLREHVDVVVKKDDVAHSKPAPDVIVAAIEKLGLSPAQCAMVGDTPHDAESAKRAGVVTLGVLCGGYNDAPTLIGAGARRTWRDPAHLLAELDDALHVASPGRAHLSREVLERLMRDALAAARSAMDAGEAPIGCVVADGDATVLVRAWNEECRTGDRTAHGEMTAFRRLAEAAPDASRDRGRKDLVLVCTLEPCVMCLGAAMIGGVDTVVYALRAPADSGTGRVHPPTSPDSVMPRIVGDVLAAESRQLFEEWLGTHRGEAQAAYVEQLLASV